MFFYGGMKFARHGKFFDLSKGQIDLEKGYHRSYYFTTIPISPKEGIARVYILENVPSKLINFVFTDDYGKRHILTVEMDDQIKSFIFEQIKSLYQSGLVERVKVRYV